MSGCRLMKLAPEIGRPAPAAACRIPCGLVEMFMWPATWQGDRGRQFNRQKGLGKWIFFQEGSFGTLDWLSLPELDAWVRRFHMRMIFQFILFSISFARSFWDLIELQPFEGPSYFFNYKEKKNRVQRKWSHAHLQISLEISNSLAILAWLAKKYKYLKKID